MKKQMTINAQLSHKINIVENNVDKRIDGLQNEIDHKFGNLQKSISRLANQQHVYPEEEPKEECLIDTMVEEHCQQQLQEGLIEKLAEYSEGLSESLDIGAAVYPWEKKEAISPLLTEEGSGNEVVEEPQRPILKPLPLGSLPATPSLDPMHTLPKPAAHETNGTPTAKVILSALPVQNFRKLVAIVQTFATTSKTLTAAHVAWHSGWLKPKPSWFRFGAWST